MNSIEDIWALVLERLSQELSPVSMKTWFEDCVPVELRKDTLVIHTSSDFKRSMIRTRYADKILDAMRELFTSEFELLILAGSEIDDYAPNGGGDSDALPELDGYTFENFIVGASNKFAHAAALGVVNNPGNRRYNPLFIYGNSGLGKTHLLKAIGSAIHERDPKARIVLVKAEDYLNELIRAIRSGSTDEFRHNFRQADLFLMDDIQFISGKEATQEEFFHTFEAIYNDGHQIVMTSDRPPRDMATLDDRLRTRFEGGLMADIQAPDKELRMAIIRDKTAHMAFSLSDEIVNYIADKLTNNIRQIEGVLNKLSAYNGLGEPITRELVDKLISEVAKDGVYIPTPEDIIREIARYFQVSVEDIKSERRQKNIAQARHISAYLIRILTNYSLQAIGDQLNRDHATVKASINKIERDISSNSAVANTVRDITSNINANAGNR